MMTAKTFHAVTRRLARAPAARPNEAGSTFWFWHCFGFCGKNYKRALSIIQLPAIVLGYTRLRRVGVWGVGGLGPQLCSPPELNDRKKNGKSKTEI